MHRGGSTQYRLWQLANALPGRLDARFRWARARASGAALAARAGGGGKKTSTGAHHGTWSWTFYCGREITTGGLLKEALHTIAVVV